MAPSLPPPWLPCSTSRRSVGRYATLALGAAVWVAAAPAFSQSGYPTKSVRILVGFPPGAGSDIVTRLITQIGRAHV